MDANEQAIDILKSYSTSSNAIAIRTQAIEALGEAGGPKAIDILKSYSTSSNAIAIRLSAIKALGRAGRIS